MADKRYDNTAYRLARSKGPPGLLQPQRGGQAGETGTDYTNIHVNHDRMVHPGRAARSLLANFYVLVS